MSIQFKPIPSLGNRYEISSCGRFLRLVGKNYFKQWRTKSHNTETKYHVARVSFHGKTKSVYAYRLVAEAWLGPIPSGFKVHHKDGDSLNDDVHNLEILPLRTKFTALVTPIVTMDDVEHEVPEWKKRRNERRKKENAK